MAGQGGTRKSKLAVHKDIVRRLSGSDLKLVAGGLGGGICCNTQPATGVTTCGTTCGATCANSITNTGCGVTNCTHGSAMTR